MAQDFNGSDVVSFGKVASGLGDHFGGDMRASDHRRLLTNYMQHTAPLQDRVTNMGNNLMRLQSQDLAYKSAQLTYKKEQEALRSQREYNNPALYNRVEEILGGDAPALEQRDQLQELARKNPQALLNVPLFAQTYTTAINQTKTRAEQEAKENTLEKGATTIANMLLHSPTEAANRAGAKVLSGEITVDEGVSVLADQRALAREMEKLEERDVKKDELLKGDLKLLEFPKTDDMAFEDALSILDDDQGTLQNEFDSLESPSERVAFMLKHQQPVRFTRIYRDKLVDRLAKSTAMTEDEINTKFPASDPNNDMLLYQAFREATDERVSILAGVRNIDELYDIQEERDIREAINPK